MDFSLAKTAHRNRPTLWAIGDVHVLLRRRSCKPSLSKNTTGCPERTPAAAKPEKEVKLLTSAQITLQITSAPGGFWSLQHDANCDLVRVEKQAKQVSAAKGDFRISATTKAPITTTHSLFTVLTAGKLHGICHPGLADLSI